MSNDQSRRAFLKRSAALGVVGTAAPFAVSLAAIGEAAAATATDYKALVCVFLFGGNDYAQTLPAYDQANYNLYAGFRPGIAYARSALDATALTSAAALPGGQRYALAPNLAPLLPVWNAGRMAAVLNVGTLVQPTTKAQYSARSVPLPPKLFSHNDQQSYWQASNPEGATSGWGGRIGDLLQSGNGNSTLTCINAGGNAVFLTGRTAVQYAVTTGGPVALNGNSANLFGSATANTTLRTMIGTQRSNLFEAEHARVTKRSLDAYTAVTAALAAAPALTAGLPAGNNLADQLRVVARMISVSQELGAKRQVFMVSIGGFDNHDSLATVHPGLMSRVGDALRYFQDSLTGLGVADRVTAFTASDFGRTLLINGDGSDHGWGSHHFVLGGAVQGQRYYGSAPVLGNNAADDVGQGRLLPTTSVDQYAATLASWFGVSATDMAMVLPNIGNYTNRNLGFI
jgi:uncharacterized protein (DUF1501 family)